MALTITELAQSRKQKESPRDGTFETTLETLWKITGSDDPSSPAVKALGPQPGDAYGDPAANLWLNSREWEIIKIGGVNGVIRLTATFGPPQRLPVQPGDEPQYELSTMAETTHIERALSQSHYPSSADSVDLAIGVADGKVDGVDIYVPKGTYSETREMQTLSTAMFAKLMGLTGCVNNAAWKYWQKGEVLFLGAQINRTGRFGVWKLKYSFAIQPTMSESIATDSGNQSFNKTGWDYMWFEKKSAANVAGDQVLHTISAVHVAKVYPDADFTQLGIGR